MQDRTETFPKVVPAELVDPASWQAVWIPPGTPQDQPAGWWVFGGEAIPGVEVGCPVALRVELASTAEGTDMSAEVAHLVAASLRDAGYRYTAPGVLHRVSWWQEVWSAMTGRAPKTRCGIRLTLQADDPPVSLSSPDCPDCTARS